jgi:Uma2 family endonuclease
MPATAEIGKKKTYTYEDYEKLPEGAPYQLIGGELVMTPAPVPNHQIPLGNLFWKLNEFIKESALGIVIVSPIDVYFSETDTYQPDIIFILKDRLNIIGEKKIEGPPDLIVEILSPATAYYDLRSKKDIYEKSGVKEYWIVDPIQKSIEIFLNRNGRYEAVSTAKDGGTIMSNLLKGLSINLHEIFA